MSEVLVCSKVESIIIIAGICIMAARGSSIAAW